MSKCTTCATEMKALFTGEYCPNECDLPIEKRTAKPPKITKITKISTPIGIMDYVPFHGIDWANIKKDTNATDWSITYYYPLKPRGWLEKCKQIASYPSLFVKPSIWVCPGDGKPLSLHPYEDAGTCVKCNLVWTGMELNARRNSGV